MTGSCCWYLIEVTRIIFGNVWIITSFLHFFLVCKIINTLFFLCFPCFASLNISAFVFVFLFSWQRIRLRGKTQLTWHLSDYTKDTVAKDLIFSENNTSVVFHYSFSTSKIFQYKYTTPLIFHYHCSIYKSNKGWNMKGSVY